MTLKGTGHGLTTADKVKAIAVDFVHKALAKNGIVEAEEIRFDGVFYQVRGHYTVEKTTKQFSVRLSKDGDIIDGTDVK